MSHQRRSQNGGCSQTLEYFLSYRNPGGNQAKLFHASGFSARPSNSLRHGIEFVFDVVAFIDQHCLRFERIMKMRRKGWIEI